MRAGDKGLARVERQPFAIAAGDRDRLAEVDDEHPLGVGQFAARREPRGALPIIAIAVDQPGKIGRRRDARHRPGIDPVVVDRLMKATATVHGLSARLMKTAA
ncbi:hypothetical protein [Sphingomonas sp.]|uniref:hypothetical protein n=1 Tax=Sphingomonas sp. TaxID=28214 RepID=UPI00257D0878|nr:hypothetical protein [Sphingomonas sp.]